MPRKNTASSHTAAPIVARPSSPAPPIAPTAAAPVGVATALVPQERRFLGRVSRFLLNVRDPETYGVAQGHGYTQSEHETAWALFRRASGEGRTLRAANPPANTSRASAPIEELRIIDGFENLWFPRTRAIIARVVPQEHRASFAAAFFRDLTQQPLGPAVILSVRTYLTRVAALPTSGMPGAREVRDTLRARGLTDAVASAMLTRLDALEVLHPGAAPPAADDGAGDEVAAVAAQREAFTALKLWFQDWATTLGTAYGKRQLITLGLRVVRRKGAEVEATDGDDEPDEV